MIASASEQNASLLTSVFNYIGTLISGFFSSIWQFFAGGNNCDNIDKNSDDDPNSQFDQNIDSTVQSVETENSHTNIAELTSSIQILATVSYIITRIEEEEEEKKNGSIAESVGK